MKSKANEERPKESTDKKGWCVYEELWAGVKAFIHWLETEGYSSYDPYDIWGTKYGLQVRRVYYKKAIGGLPLIAPIVVLELIFPRGRSVFVEKKRYATADAQLMLAFLNLHRVTGGRAYLEKAMALGDDLLGYSISGYSGFCWGYPFDWQNDKGLWKRQTPYITCTPYCFEAFLALHAATEQGRYLDIAESIANFVYADLRDTETGVDEAAASYSPNDQTKVINASAYRAFVLTAAAEIFGKPEFKAKALKNINFILRNQREDGAWPYEIGTPAEAFIDHFHTCFVLKNLFKLNHWLGSDEVRGAILKGYQYYRQELFDRETNPKSFAQHVRMEIVHLELYNFAEAITLGAMLRDDIPDAFLLAHNLAAKLIEKYQLPDGHFVTRVYLGGLRHTLPFLRWPQAQLFYAITNLLLLSTNSSKQERAPLSATIELTG